VKNCLLIPALLKIQIFGSLSCGDRLNIFMGISDDGRQFTNTLQLANNVFETPHKPVVMQRALRE